MTNEAAIGYADVAEAAARLVGKTVRTPLIENDYLNELVGGRILLKAECLQRTGSYKFRGAYNRLSSLNADQKKNGVVAYSSGNHAQGVALAAKLLNIPAVIVMPSDAPEIKIAGTRRYGAEIVFYDRWTESREQIADDLAAERVATVVSSYDDPFIMAGQGTVGIEFIQQSDAADAIPHAILIPFGGGGLSSGITTALQHLAPSTRIYTVEPDGFDDMRKSLAAGQRVSNPPGGRSICDALLAPEPGALTFPIVSAAGAEGLVVSDAEVESAMVFAAEHLKLVVEPGGAVALAAMLSGKVSVDGQTLGIVISGGNVDLELYSRIVGKAARAP